MKQQGEPEIVPVCSCGCGRKIELAKWELPYYRRGWNDAKAGVEDRGYHLYPNRGRHSRGWNRKRRDIYDDGYRAAGGKLRRGIA